MTDLAEFKQRGFVIYARAVREGSLPIALGFQLTRHEALADMDREQHILTTAAFKVDIAEATLTFIAPAPA